MTIQEIIKETVNFYSVDPVGRRAKEFGECVYYDPDTGNKCAVGRCIVDDVVKSKWFPTHGVASPGVTSERTMEILGHLKPRYEGHPPLLWKHLQELHDGDEHWDKHGLTAKGAAKVQEIYDYWDGRITT